MREGVGCRSMRACAETHNTTQHTQPPYLPQPVLISSAVFLVQPTSFPHVIFLNNVLRPGESSVHGQVGRTG
ncbi:hypothetical protein PCANC_15708 [Puccinia coronata f. sp. avenae]|uniref:Uncharacterized protein n=1 Tax=Puccinia coronata f. sp. avenae TaxID=200324 RepID=A0A2N5SNC2_9BASI|nr:hypothetical protein PCANC_15708 [Puccinia coronata f. sp. avenae]